MIEKLIQEAIEKKKALRGSRAADLRFLPTTISDRGVPTLESNTFRPFSPQLWQRYQMFGRWERATHGHWLGLDDMAALWSQGRLDGFLEEIKSSQIAGKENWPNEVSALFRPERLSLFACSDINNEKIYMLWLDCEDEPECWVYDSNGESRYKDLAHYLKAYLTDDISAAEQSWRL